MELKRILAKDLRRATEKAVKLYGEDVLVISNAKVNGQVEVIVAVDVSPELHASEMGASEPGRFGEVLQHSLKGLPAPSDSAEDAADSEDEQDLTYSAPARKRASSAKAAKANEDQPAADHREYIRGREIVDMVRDELSAIRKEFKLAQRVASWQPEMAYHPAVKPLVQALAEASIPVSLRTLLVDGVNGMEDLQQAQDALRAQLVQSIGEHWAKLPQRGVHAITGPAGSGKTLMVARLARAAAERKGAESVAVISYADQRAGAWSQIQMLCAQAGVDCLRANDPDTLKMMLAELGQRNLILIDTPGVETLSRVAQLTECCPELAVHLVLPADAATTTVRKYLIESPTDWASLMTSRMDEATQPWPLLQALCEKSVPLSAASHSPSANDHCQVLTATELVSSALRGLGLDTLPVADELIDDLADPSVLTAAQALVARIEKSSHAS